MLSAVGGSVYGTREMRVKQGEGIVYMPGKMLPPCVGPVWPYCLTRASYQHKVFFANQRFPVKGLHWTIVGLGIVLSISSIALRVDDPVTPYDESETPFNLVAPISFQLVARPLRVREDRRITLFEREPVRRNDGTTTYLSQFRLNLLSKTLLC